MISFSGDILSKSIHSYCVPEKYETFYSNTFLKITANLREHASLLLLICLRSPLKLGAFIVVLPLPQDTPAKTSHTKEIAFSRSMSCSSWLGETPLKPDVDIGHHRARSGAELLNITAVAVHCCSATTALLCWRRSHLLSRGLHSAPPPAATYRNIGDH